MIGLYIMAGAYALAGIMHFVVPKFYLAITPKWVPAPAVVNVMVGLAEIALGIGLVLESTRSLAAWGVIALLIAVFPANVYHFQKARRKGQALWMTALRLPLQAVLIYWAWLYV